MKRLFILLAFITIFVEGQAQDGYITFDNSSDLFRIYIDTSISNNVWQIGHPNKQLFMSAYSPPNAMITDSLYPYPINNTSIFYLGIAIPNPYPGFYEETDFAFYYKIDSDTLNDYGTIEFSVDTGKTYYNLIQTVNFQVTDSVGNVIANNESGNPVVFTGRSNGWYLFWSELMGLPDSVIFRFTFHSDSNQYLRDGWMIDNIGWFTWWEGIQENFSAFKIFPNPAKEILQVDSKRKIKEVSIITELGQTLLTKSITNMPVTLNVKSLEQGFYIMKIVYEGNEIMMKRFLVQK